MSDTVDETTKPIALIGASCRFPGGCNSPERLWQLLTCPVDLLAEIPSTRFDVRGFFHVNAEHPGTTNVKGAYLLEDDPLAFDNEFFNISAREAESMDPQQRIVLETVYEAIESSGYSMSQLRGSSIGVFVGQMTDDYRDLVLRDVDFHPQYTATGTARSILANRISYVFDWTGPSLNIDTACSSSLVALHQAVQSLRSGESEMAVVAGVNLVFNPEYFSFLSSLRMISPTGRSRMWDASADGYARGEGFAVIVLKTLERALADHDDVESVIRNTSVNQDGRSSGLTVPRAAAHAKLIKTTYARCELDYRKEEDRCQYFEAHGTGTMAGDPKEAEGISMTFFPKYGLESNDNQTSSVYESQKIYVGSIKTVIGHTEGTAGLASLLKASQAVQHGLIPPNLHFTRLNPAIQPYYHHLEVPTRLIPWPALPTGASRRASVNSFGFGGTNAHAIVESWENKAPDVPLSIPPSNYWGPFVFSARSQTALSTTIACFSAYLKSRDNIDLSRLAWTLQMRRDRFSYRASFSASTKEELVEKLDLAVGTKEIGTKAIKTANPRILGVFTGQGAQWASMGASLFLHSAAFRRSFQKLDSALQNIPSSAPTWSLQEELLKPEGESRTSSAEISQPLCTALQIALVDLLRECGITLSAVVGHSSGEIAAAYAAGVLQAHDAILIAFYRGLHCRQYASANTKPGKMIALSMDPKEAEALCCQPPFAGKINIAARNSPSTVTLSGDGEMIDEVEKTMDQKGIFARILKTDNMAYHSHHMEFVREPYEKALREADIQPMRPCFGGPCKWYSSVYDDDEGWTMDNPPVAFGHAYWVENLTSPVLFSKAITSAVRQEGLDAILEIGPHPALRGPVAECVKHALSKSLPYHGVLVRNEDALVSFSNVIGRLWNMFDSGESPSIVDFLGFRKACEGPGWLMPRVLKGLPSYPWNHDRSMLKESKKSKAWRTRDTPFHELLGYPCPTGGKSGSGVNEVRWRNILRLSNLEWLQGHQFQNQVLMPASSFLVMAVHAALHLFRNNQQPVRLVELQDVVIHNGITLEEGSSGVEMNFVIRVIEESSPSSKMAEFYCSCNNACATSPDYDKDVVTGRILVSLDSSNGDDVLLPSRVTPSLPMTDVSPERFYSWMKKIGLHYSGPFVSESIKRRLNLATITTIGTETNSYVIHPATLDSVLQGLYAAFSYPGDGRVWTTYLPQKFRRVRFSMDSCRRQAPTRCTTSPPRLVADCYLETSSARAMCGDIDVFCAQGGHAAIQMQGVVLSSLEVPTEANDPRMFWQTIWKREISSAIGPGRVSSTRGVSSCLGSELHDLCERTAYFYLRHLYNEVGRHEIQQESERYLKSVYPSYQFDRSSSSRNAHWNDDTLDSILALQKQEYCNQADLQLINHIGPRLPSVLLRGSEPAWQPLELDDMLKHLYTEGLGVAEIHGYMGSLLEQLVHQYPRMRILELNVDEGESTSIILKHLESRFEEYTFTSSSSSTFFAVKARFSRSRRHIRCQVLDIEQPPISQGFDAHSYDLIITVRPFHPTRSKSEILRHCRQLLRPGGYMIIVELTNPEILRIPLLLARQMERWSESRCVNGDDQPPITLTEAQWDLILKDNNFSGVDHALRDFEDDSMHTYSVMVSQAVDDRVKLLKNPLDLGVSMPRLEKLLIIGGRTLDVSKLATGVKYLLGSFAKQTIVATDLEDDVLKSNLKYGNSAVICLTDLEEATFKLMNPQRLSAMHSLFREAKYILWVTRGCRDDDPYASVMVGIGRTVGREMAHLRLKLVDFNPFNQPEASLLSGMLLQMVYLDLPTFDELLWANETELAIENGSVLIPRVVLDHRLNDCFNSVRRKITRSVSLASTPVEISHKDDRGVLVRQARHNFRPEVQTQTGLASFRVLSSSLFRFCCSDSEETFYLCIGSSEVTGHTSLVMTGTNGSFVTASPGHTFECHCGNTGVDEMLSTVLTVLLCESFLSCTNGDVWVHVIDDNTAKLIHEVAARMEVTVYITTSNTSSALISTGKAHYIHSQATDRELRSVIPRNITQFVSMSAESRQLTEFATSLGESKVETRVEFRPVGISQIISLAYTKSALLQRIREHCASTELLREVEHLVWPHVVQVDQFDHVYEQSETAIASGVISWTNISDVQVRVLPAVRERLFGDQKTYLLIGLAGDLGLSLCDWMTDHGARYFAIASRNPAIAPEVIAHLERKGAIVRVFSLDVADKKRLEIVHDDIMSSMPPIAGVANAALVVRDHPFDNMSLEDFEDVFKPKVIGTLNLDDLFFSTPLDFFILFSSVANVVGRPAQSGYNAANLFMATVAARRRKRGLAASVMHFGMLLGLGFIHGQGGPSVEARFRQDDLPAIPEPDFHSIFAQAVLSGHPQSGLSPEIIAGLGTEIDTPWRAIPRLWHCRVETQEGRTEHENQERIQSSSSIQDQLIRASDDLETLSIVKTSIVSRLSLAIGSPREIDDQIGLLSLGIDSLVAVEMRSWLLNILEVDVPVLKFLSGSSLHDISTDVMGKLPESLTPWAKNDHKQSCQEVSTTSIISTQDVQVDAVLEDSRITQALEPCEPGKPVEHAVVADGSSLSSPRHAPTSGQTYYERIGEMSYSQAQLYFLHRYLSNNAYNVTYLGRFHGRLDIDRLRSALWAVGKRHEAVRSAYFVEMETSRPVQAVLPEPRIILTHKMANSDDQALAETEATKEYRFDIENGIVLKVTVVSQSPIVHSLSFSHHHIALDGISWTAFISDLARAYSGRLPSTPEIHQSIDIAAKQLKMLTARYLDPDLEFWRQTFKIIPEPLPLFPFTILGTRPTTKDYTIDTIDLRLPRDFASSLDAAAASIEVTSFHFYLASFATFLARCLHIDEIVIGIVDANRSAEEDMSAIGYFLNMLPVRIQMGHSEPFDVVARRVRNAVLAALTHSRTPFDMILDALEVSKSTPHHPLFQVAVNYRKASLNETDFGRDGIIEWHGAIPGGNPYDLLLNVAATPDWTFLSFNVQRSLYERSDGALLLKWYTHALKSLVRDPYCQVGKCPLAAETDILAAIELGRGDNVMVPWEGTLAARVGRIAADFPERVAIRWDQDHYLTYSEMMVRVSQISHKLRAISPSLADGSHVAMLLDPGADAICCILATLRLGLVLIPLDTRNHHVRLRAVVEESQPQVLVCHDATIASAKQVADGLAQTRTMNIDEHCVEHLGADGSQDEESCGGISCAWKTVENNAAELEEKPAIILYTSGSMGFPKGVMLTHRGLKNQIYGTIAALQLGSETTLQQSPLGFDLMIDQVFLALCNSGTVVVVGKSGRGDPVHISKLMIEHSVTLTHFVPSEYLALLNYGHHVLSKAQSWRYALSGGEKAGQELRRAFRKLGCKGLQLVNVYGPAEITVACAKGVMPYHDLSDVHNDHSDYLCPSPNYNIEIMDPDMNTLPIGFPGEICISGPGVALGYLERPDESSSKFLERTSTGSSSRPTKIYRSGDKGRLLPDGTLKILGRLDGDSQVKIHGFRIELDEIANAIVRVSNGKIVNAAASWRPSLPPGILVAFVVFDVEFTDNKSDFLEWLRSNLPLPSIMIPRFLVPIERVPTTANGKTDKAAVHQLPIPDPANSTHDDIYTGSYSSWEQSIKDIWDEILSTKSFRVSGNDRTGTELQPSSDFFQVGGSSIMMIKLKSLLEVQFGVNLSMPNLFHASTLSGMASLVANSLSNRETAASTSITTTPFLKPRNPHQVLDWDLEIASMADGLPQPRPVSSISHQKSPDGGLVIVLTGASGFIGRHILSHLIQDPRVAEVHCVAVRPDKSGSPRALHIESDKITSYVGDLATLSLNLSDAQYSSLVERSHAIIHNGADVSLLKTYRSLRRANVVSTRKFCEMAIPRRVPLHFISTASAAKVMKRCEDDPLPEVSASPADPTLANSVDGYAASKWCSERLLEMVTANNELPSYIHRLAHVVGQDSSELDAVGMLFKYSLLLRALPRIESENIAGQWDFIMVQDVTRDIVTSVVESVIGNNGASASEGIPQARFINHCSDIKVPHNELGAYLENMAGGPLDVIDMKDWLQRAHKMGLHPLVHTFLTAFSEGQGQLVLPLIARSRK
ncbi:hybrid PKS-NRPS PsoA [Xylaria scruposa]|nr:hybrid PKS-NRPS PsoA [Xylaria scruposa]